MDINARDSSVLAWVRVRPSVSGGGHSSAGLLARHYIPLFFLSFFHGWARIPKCFGTVFLGRDFRGERYIFFLRGGEGRAEGECGMG